MELSITTFLILCPLTFLGGFVDAVAGGGGLITLPAYLLAGVPVHNAIATNKVSASMGTSVSVFKLAKLGYIPWRKAALCIVMAVIGSAGGAKLALLVSDDLFKKILLVVIPLTAFYVMRTRDLDEKEPLGMRQTIIRAAILALVIGAYDGFYGPGTGTFLILLLTAFAHFRLGEANGVSKAINLTTNISSLVVYLLNGKVILLLGLAGGVSGIIGNYLGVTLFAKKGSKVVKPLMLIVLTIFFFRTLSEML